MGESVITINNQTRVCYQGNMTGFCDTEGEIYKQEEDERVICANGRWVRQNITSMPSTSTGTTNKTTQPSVVPDTSNQTTTETSDPNSCLGEGFVTANNVTKACVDGKWTTDCSTEGELYYESDFLEVKIVCENGRWVSKPLE